MMKVNVFASTSQLADAARARVVPMARQRIVVSSQHGSSSPAPSFDLYHFGFSICSNKVRTVLAELAVSWQSFELDPSRHENYKPDYVRLRLASEAARSGALATGWEGGSSVREAGFDALVVPTLYDRRSNEVVADSLSICLHLVDSMPGGPDLIPSDLASDVRAELDIVDRTPHVALLYGANPDGDTRAYMYRRAFRGEHERKAVAAEREAARVKGESAAMDAAYAAKIQKERSGRSFVASKQKMRATVADTNALLGDFARSLARSGGPWIFGDRYTLADVFWGVSLFRLEYLGYGTLYRAKPDREAVSGYAGRVFARAATSAAVAHWPSHPWSRPVAKWMPRPTLRQRLLGLGS